MLACLFGEPEMTDYIIGLGSNLGDRQSNIDRAIDALNERSYVTVLKRSYMYETAPWGDLNQPAFYNACVRIKSTLTASQLLNLCLDIEHAMGRMRRRKWGPRLIDLDIVWSDGPSVQTKQLQIPHAYAHHRAFVLIPLIDVGRDAQIEGQLPETHLEFLPREEVLNVRRIGETAVC